MTTSAPSQPPSPRTRVRRASKRAHYDPDTVAAIARDALVCHIAFADADGVHCIPISCWYHAGQLHIHGAAGSRMFLALTAGEVCVTLTHVDGLVLARSAYHHSMNYRSVVAYGRFEPVEDEAEKRDSFATLIDTLAPGRWPHVRQPTREELAATMVMRLPLTEASAKMRNVGVKDNPADMSWPIWAGVVPLRLAAGAPLPEAGCEGFAPPRHWQGKQAPLAD